MRWPLGTAEAVVAGIGHYEKRVAEADSFVKYFVLQSYYSRIVRLKAHSWPAVYGMPEGIPRYESYVHGILLGYNPATDEPDFRLETWSL
jgi:hypothetical protein